MLCNAATILTKNEIDLVYANEYETVNALQIAFLDGPQRSGCINTTYKF